MTATRERTHDFLSGGGDVGALMRACDWTSTALGDPATWPQSLRTVVGLMLHSRHPMFIAWGEELNFLYNDGYAPILGAKHPVALGRPFQGVWEEIWDDVGPLVRRALAGEATWAENMHLVMERNGYPEDTWYTFSYSPLNDETGRVAGMFCACTETTGQVLADRAAAFRLRLDEVLRNLEDPLELLAAAQEALGRGLDVGRAGYGDVDPEGRTITVRRDWTDGAMPSLAGEARPLESFGSAIIDELRAGRTLVLHDVATDLRTAEAASTTAFASIDARSMVVTPLIKSGRLTAILYAHDPQPRRWSQAEVALVEQVAERTWAELERARAESGRRAMEEALHRQLAAETARLRELFEQAPSFMAVVRGPQHVFELVNPPYERLVGRRDLIGKTVREALPDVEGQGFFGRLDHVYATGETYVGSAARIDLAPEGEPPRERIVDFVYQPIRDALGRIEGVFVEGIDITDRYEADERLRVAQRAGRIGAFEWFPETGQVEVSAEYREIFGLPPSGAVTDGLLLSLVQAEDRDFAANRRLARNEDPLAYAEFRIRRPDNGEIRWVARQGEVIHAPGRARPRYLGVAYDITGRKTAEDALRRLNETLEQRVSEALAERKLWADVFEATDVIISVADHDYNWLAVNRAFVEQSERVYGFRPRAGENLLAPLERMPRIREAVHALWRRALAGESFTETGDFGAEGLERVTYEIKYSPLRDRDGKIIGAVQIAQDVSQRVANEQRLRQTEEALRQAQKMEAVGQLTGGIAHDFNNLLQGIIGSLDFVKKRIDQGRTDDLDRFIDGAIASASRAAALTHRLLAFSRRQPLNPRPVQANPLIASMQDLLRRTLGETVDLTMALSDDLWPTLADANQIESAVLNLAINARDAMPGGGALKVKTCNVTLAEPECAPLGLKPGEYVCVQVADTGVGMTPDVLERAFDPFFTTKPIGQGTGLGLSMIYGFARQSDGAVQIDSEVGGGTAVRLYLPRYDGAAVEEAAPEAEALQPGAGEVVLVVEDEAVVRELVVEILRELGYRSLQAEDGPSALTILQSNQRVDLLVTDVGLPGLNGRQVADAARRSRPELKVLLMTGYAESAMAEGAAFLEPGMAMITKPFSNEAMGKLVQDVLAAPRPLV